MESDACTEVASFLLGLVTALPVGFVSGMLAYHLTRSRLPPHRMVGGIKESRRAARERKKG